MTTPGATTYRLPDRRCPLCGDKIINPGAHAERCYGRSARVAPPTPPDPGSECGCNAGGWHERDCVHVVGETGT